MRASITTAFLILAAGSVSAQQRSTSHALQLQLEILGPGVSCSFNIDSRLLKKENGPGFRLGLGITPLAWLKDPCNRGSLNSLPLGINYLLGKGRNLLELEAGAVLLFMSGTKINCLNSERHFFSEETGSFWFSSIGYRFQPVRRKGLSYRVFVSPLFQKGFPAKFWGGAGLGYRF